MLQQHLALATVFIFLGFAIGAYGHMTKSLTLILIGIAMIAVISAIVLTAYETQIP